MRLAEIRRLGASFVAVSPEEPAFSQGFSAKEHIEFPVLRDFGNAMAQQFGLAFEVDEALKGLMTEMGY